MTEEIKPGEGTPAPASGDETPEGTPEGEPETPDYKAELEQEKKLRQDAETKAQRETEARQKAEGKIVKLKNKMDEAGIQVEDEPGLSEDRVQEIVKSAVSEAVKPFVEQTEKAKLEAEEAKRALAGKATQGDGSGAGQKKPVKKGPPALSEESKKIVQQFNLHWDSDKEDWVGLSGKTHPGGIASS